MSYVNFRWYFFSFTLSARSQTARMRVWRRLNSMGAVLVKNAFYALPASPRHHEQLTWLVKEVEGLGGEALFLETAPPSNMTGAQLARLFTQARDADWAALERELTALLDSARDDTPDAEPGSGREACKAGLKRIEKRIEALAGIDFFPGGRGERVRALAAEGEALCSGKRSGGEACIIPVLDPADWGGKTWLTREDPYIDRLASFWLVRRFVDPEAAIEFAPADSAPEAKPGVVRFDMAEAEFTHVGRMTTFEVLCASFRLERALPLRLRDIIHAIDMDETDAGPPEAPGVKLALDGIVSLHPDSLRRTEQAMLFFDALLAACKTPNGETS
ncbi:chromate resistance protein ChrB domain-containing protein [Fundidesulfovibrio agrisoli]|uniref:chromate resistance protein ChrB domain-containing protein n=1 Tax=Fundidesulfovibrio agrisoli TaxID=2922717 RepID=UPI001FAD0D95|nr:chromate resistance protein ChrB domain-containing protein [Fundidesulfovibrio agrisoli]